jgi:1-acyl-sn-glycerol-3-phosphate acyltransferase
MHAILNENIVPADRTVLTRYNLDDVVVAFAAQQRPLRRIIVRTLAWLPAHRLAQTLVDADGLAATAGLPAACALLIERIAGTSDIIGAAQIPATGAVVCVANHPGLVDVAGLCVAIGRQDIRIIAAERPLLQALPGFTQHLISVPESGPGRAHALRAAVRHLRAGGALLTFPAGRIEPDPAVQTDAHATLPLWSDMPATLRRAVPGVPLVAMLASGVTSARALSNPLVQRVPVRRDREWLAATLQLIIPWYKARVVRIRVAQVAAQETERNTMHALIVAERRARGLSLPEALEDK